LKYIRYTFRVFIALILAALAFVIGVFLPLFVWWFVHGDPGMPGGAGLAMVGFPLGAIAASITGIFALIKLDPREELSRPTTQIPKTPPAGF
jgi:hypothetical protein